MSNNQWPGGYPPQGQPNPQQGYPQGQPTPPQQGYQQGQPYGQPEPAQQPYSQPGYTPNYGQQYQQPGYEQQPYAQPYAAAYGVPPEPPRRGSSPALIALIVVLVVLLGVGSYFLFFNKGNQAAAPSSSAATSTASTETTKPSEEPADKPSEDPADTPAPKQSSEEPTPLDTAPGPGTNTGGTAPAMPKSFGDFRLTGPGEEYVNTYTGSDNTIVATVFLENLPYNDAFTDGAVKDPEKFGDITCGHTVDNATGSLVCVTGAHGGILTLSAVGPSVSSKSSIAEITKAFLAAWK